MAGTPGAAAGTALGAAVGVGATEGPIDGTGVVDGLGAVLALAPGVPDATAIPDEAGDGDGEPATGAVARFEPTTTAITTSAAAASRPGAAQRERVDRELRRTSPATTRRGSTVPSAGGMPAATGPRLRSSTERLKATAC